jgi:hypothetical protein
MKRGVGAGIQSMMSAQRTFWLLSLLVTGACTESRTMSEETLTTITPNLGGTAASADGRLTLRIPAGAVASTTEIRIAIERTGAPAAILGGVSYRFEPDGLQFAVPVEVWISGVPVEADDEIALAQILDTGVEVLDTSVHDPDASTVNATLEHFSRYGLIRRANPCRGLSCGASCNAGTTPHRCNFRNRCVPAGIPLFCAGGPDGGPGFDAGIPDTTVGADIHTPDTILIPADGSGADGGMPLPIGEVEPNDSAAQAQNVPANNAGSNTFGTLTAGDEDWYSFDVPQGFAPDWRIYTSSDGTWTSNCFSPLDTVITLLDSSLNPLAENDDASSGTRCSHLSSYDEGFALQPGRYYVRVRSFAPNSVAPYVLTIYLQLSPGLGWDASGPGPDGSFFDYDASPFDPDAGLHDFGPADVQTVDASSGGFDGFLPDRGGPAPDGGVPGPIAETEPNDDRANANPIPYQLVTHLVAALSPAGDNDYFRVVIAPGDTLSIGARTYTNPVTQQCSPVVDTYLEVQNSAGTVLAANDDVSQTIGCSMIDPQGNAPGAAFLPSGTYYVRARHFAPSGTAATYYLEIDLF